MAFEHLIDMMKEWVLAQGFLTHSYVTRGAHDAWDFFLTDLVVDGNWHDMDLSPYIPVGVSAVNLHIVCSTTQPTDVFYLKPKSFAPDWGTCTLRPQIAGLSYCVRRAFFCDADRVFSYRFLGVGWTFWKINVKGWWP